MYKYYLKNINTGVYLKYISDLKFKHYVLDFEEASLFTYQRAYYLKNRFKHPENWVINKKKIKEK